MFAQLEDLKDFLSLGGVEATESPLLLCLNASNALIRSYTNRVLESTKHVEYVTAMNPYKFLVPEFPVTAVHGITAMQFSTDTVGYPCDMAYVKYGKSGWVQTSEGLITPGFPKNVLIEYTAGYSSTDVEYETLKWITLEIAGQLFRGRGTMNTANYQSGGAQFQRFDHVLRASEFGETLAMLGPEVLIMLSMFARRGPRPDD